LGNYQGYVPAFDIPVVGTTGAGDAFVAGFLHQCCQWGNNVCIDPQLAQRAVIYASAVGALTTTHPGAIAPCETKLTALDATKLTSAQPTLETVQKFIQANLESIVC
jgi:fructokinase